MTYQQSSKANGNIELYQGHYTKSRISAVSSLDPFSSSVFLFCGRRTDMLKALYYDKDGFVLMQKRLNKRMMGSE